MALISRRSLWLCRRRRFQPSGSSMPRTDLPSVFTSLPTAIRSYIIKSVSIGTDFLFLFPNYQLLSTNYHLTYEIPLARAFNSYHLVHGNLQHFGFRKHQYQRSDQRGPALNYYSRLFWFSSTEVAFIGPLALIDRLFGLCIIPLTLQKGALSFDI